MITCVRTLFNPLKFNTYSLFLVAMEGNNIHRRHPLLEFILPVSHGRLRYNNNVRAVHTSHFFQVAQEGHSLQCFTQTLLSKTRLRNFIQWDSITHHFVGQNAVNAIVVELDQPVEPV